MHQNNHPSIIIRHQARRAHRRFSPSRVLSFVLALASFVGSAFVIWVAFVVVMLVSR
jgi:hypothetical protein